MTPVYGLGTGCWRDLPRRRLAKEEGCPAASQPETALEGGSDGGPHWIRTSDLYDVNVAL